MIDEDGFRQNVGIILVNKHKEFFWGKRIGQDAWQFPQGGVNADETAEQALFRELEEEVGLKEKDVKVIACTADWLKYLLPKRLVRVDSSPLCIGQKQKWFLLSLESDESQIKLDECVKPEFDDWRWVSYWFPLHQVVAFKREVYRQALLEFFPLMMQRHIKNYLLDPLD